MPSKKNKDLLIKGGLIALLIFLLRKAGTSAPLPGDTFGAPETFGGGDIPRGKYILFDSNKGKLQVWQKAGGNTTNFYTVFDKNKNSPVIVEPGQVIGRALKSLKDSNGINWILLDPVYKTDLAQWVPIDLKNREPNGYWIK